jgi:hypothetical protein
LPRALDNRGSDAEPFAALAAGCHHRISLRFDVASRREEQPNLVVVDQRDIKGVRDRERQRRDTECRDVVDGFTRL